MALPDSRSNIYWKDYEISTPTFELTPVEKPDMSPFLFHMTGRNALLSVLRGEGVAEGAELAAKHGFLKACIPRGNGGYTASVVCFTESPAFALDFFRYRSFHRWQEDQQFGVGFDKATLASRGVRPCVYADSALNSDVLFLKRHLSEIEPTDDAFVTRVKSLIEQMYPLTTPLLEGKATQGFMWEREWRYYDEEYEGFAFPYDAIRVICCPAAEEPELRALLGAHAENIQFIRAWKEYDEVTGFLKRQKLAMAAPVAAAYKDTDDFKEALAEQLKAHTLALHCIEAYSDVIGTFDDKKPSVHGSIEALQGTIDAISLQISELAKAKEQE